MKAKSKEVGIWTTNQVVLATLFVVFVFLSFWLLYRFRAVVFLIFMAIVIGTTMRPAVEWLYRHGISRAVGVMLIYLLIAGCLAGILALLVPLIVDQATQFFQHLPQYQTDLQNMLLDSHNLILQNIGLRIPTRWELFSQNDPTTQEVINTVNQTFHYVNLVLKGALSILAVLLLAYYWTQESNFVLRGLLRLVPFSHRQGVREFLQVMEVKIGGYVRGQAILSAVVGVASFIAYALIGLPYALILAIVAGILEAVPIFGPFLGAIPALLVALSVEPGRVIWVLAATTVIQSVENVWLVPRIMNHEMGVNPIVVLLSLIAFSSFFGFPGALLALPLAAIVQLIVERIVNSAREPGNSSQAERLNIKTLLDQSEATVKSIENNGEPGKPTFHKLPEHICQEITSIAQGLHELLDSMKHEEGG